MTLYVKATRDGRDWYAEYMGLDEGTITALVENLGASDVTFISEDVYLTATTAV